MTDPTGASIDLVEDALRADALAQVRREGPPEPQWVMTHWFAITAWTRADESGQIATLRVHFRDDVMPLWQLRGLLHEALRICAGSEDEEDA